MSDWTVVERYVQKLKEKGFRPNIEDVGRDTWVVSAFGPNERYVERRGSDVQKVIRQVWEDVKE